VILKMDFLFFPDAGLPRMTEVRVTWDKAVITTLGAFANAVEDAVIAKGTEIGIAVARAAIFMPTYTQGA
jgi:hypothetical protein